MPCFGRRNVNTIPGVREETVNLQYSTKSFDDAPERAKLHVVPTLNARKSRLPNPELAGEFLLCKASAFSQPRE